MTSEAQSITDQIRQMAQAKGMEPLDLLRAWLAREQKDIATRLSKHERKLKLVRA